MRTQQVAVRNGAFDIEVWEAGSGSPLLYLHGEGSPTWTPFHDALAERYRVIAPIHPGYGLSTGNEQLQDLPDLIYYYLDVLDQLGLRDLPLIGHGLGGMVAAELAAVQPDRFRALVLIAPMGLWLADDPVQDFFVMSPADLAAALYHDPDSPAARAAAETPTEGDAQIEFHLERAKSLATAAKYLWRSRTEGSPDGRTVSRPPRSSSGVRATASRRRATPRRSGSGSTALAWRSSRNLGICPRKSSPTGSPRSRRHSWAMRVWTMRASTAVAAPQLRPGSGP